MVWEPGAVAGPHTRTNDYRRRRRRAPRRPRPTARPAKGSAADTGAVTAATDATEPPEMLPPPLADPPPRFLPPPPNANASGAVARTVTSPRTARTVLIFILRILLRGLLLDRSCIWVIPIGVPDPKAPPIRVFA